MGYKSPSTSGAFELGKALAGQVRNQIMATRREGASVAGLNASTTNMLESYLKQSKESENTHEEGRGREGGGSFERRGRGRVKGGNVF